MQGTTLGPYRIDAEVGSGGMGRVYAATVVGRCPGLAEGTRVALKVVHPHLLDTPGFFKRFLREGEIGKSVVHENVVRTFDCDAVRENHFLVMEYVEGQTLRDLLDELDRVPEELCRHIGREVTKGLAAIHAAGVVHRDIKPENVLITKEHVVKVMDLGVARLVNEALRLSQTGAFVGSIHYAAPEQFRGPAPRSREGAARSAEGVDGVDGRADLHALGLVLYELSCGVNPYFAESVPEVLEKVLHEEPRRLGDVNPQLSPFFEELVHNLLAKSPADRFADATTLLGVLEDGEKSAWWTSRSNAIRAVTHRPLRRIRIPRETSVYGREAELSLLRDRFARAASGDGQVVVLEGEAGIGKSRVVDEFVGLLQREGADLNFLFGSCPPGGAATASGAFSTAYREQFGEADLDETLKAYLTATPVLVPAFAALLRGETTPSGVEPLTKDSLQTCFVHATRNLAAERTTIVLIDDLHFAPDEGRALFAALALAVPGHRILLIGTTRPGLDEKWLANIERIGTSRARLARLGPKDLARLLADAFRSERLAEELGVRIALKSDGNPFFVFEILRGLRDGRFITRRTDGTWTTTRVIDEIRIPSSVLELVQARVGDLSRDERNALDVAACLGFEFDPGLVAAVLGVGRVPLLQSLAHVEKAHRLVRSAGRRFVFDHHQVQEALYGGLPEMLREEYHAAIAAALEAQHAAATKDPETLDGALCAELCGHALAGARHATLLRYLPRALTHLERSYLNAQAVDLAERALAVPGLLAGADRARTLLRLCVMLRLIGRAARQVAAVREVEEISDATGDGQLRIDASYAIGWCLYQTARYAEAEASFRRAQATACSRGDRKQEAGAIGNLGTVLDCQGRRAEAREHYTRSRDMFREIGDRQGEAHSTSGLGIAALSEGRHAEALGLQGQSLAIYREIGDRQGEAVALHNLAGALWETGEAEAAIEHLRSALALVEEIGFSRLGATTHLAIGSIQADLRDDSLARESFEKARDDASRIGAAGVETLARCHMACLPGGDAQDARDCLARNDERLDEDERLTARWLLWRATAERADLAEAKRLLDASVANVPDDVRAAMLANVRLNRDVAAAAKASGL